MPKRILIAEDEPTTREILTSLAKSQGYDVIAVTNGVDLLSVAAHEHFDVVITDLMMADLDGASATEIMKMQGNTTPVIALTGVSTDDLHLIRDKFTRIFQKPVNISELFEYVDSLIRG
ncbi:MAG: response regulator [Desulfuromonadales bacterium]|nr:response regulator [Desulfuromonadales bacterium]